MASETISIESEISQLTEASKSPGQAWQQEPALYQIHLAVARLHLAHQYDVWLVNCLLNC